MQRVRVSGILDNLRILRFRWRHVHIVHVLQPFSKWQQIAQYQLYVPSSRSPQLLAILNATNIDYFFLQHFLVSISKYCISKTIAIIYDSFINYKFFKQVIFRRIFWNYSNLLWFDFNKKDNLCWSMKSLALFKGVSF